MWNMDFTGGMGMGGKDSLRGRGLLREIEAYKECIVVYIMVAYPAAVARTRNLQKLKELKVVRGPAWVLPQDVVS